MDEVDIAIEDLIERSDIFKKYLRKALPLEHFIYMKLLEYGALTDKNLMEIIRLAQYDVGEAEVMSTLMKMEIRGLLYVEASKDGNIIRLVKEKRYLVADED